MARLCTICTHPERGAIEAAMLGGELFVLDYREGSIHVLDPLTQKLHRTLPIDSRYGIHIGGGLASTSYPNRLYIADAFDTGLPRTGSAYAAAQQAFQSPDIRAENS